MILTGNVRQGSLFVKVAPSQADKSNHHWYIDGPMAASDIVRQGNYWLGGNLHWLLYGIKLYCYHSYRKNDRNGM